MAAAAALRRSLALAALLALGGAAASAQRVSAAGAAIVDTIAAALVETAGLPSLSIAALEDGRVAFARAYGWADREKRIPADTTTVYRLASVSKIVTATAALRLVQRGRLDLDAPVATYLPAFPGGEAMTPRQLAGHLAGIGHYQREDRIDRTRQYASVEDAFDTFRASPRVGAPGQRYEYSTHGFTLLSGVVEAAAGRPFLDFVASEVFGPLGMGRSGPDLRADPSATMAALYGGVGARATPIARPENPSYKWGGGGLVSTPSDLVRLAAGYLDGYIDPAVRDDAWTTQRTASGEATGVGVAWRVGVDFAGRRIIHHAGAMGGARSVLVLYPDDRAAIATTTNAGWTSAIELNAQVLLEALRAPPPRPGARVTGVTEGTFDSKAATGRIRLDGWRGWLTTPAPMKEWFRAAPVDSLPVFHLGGDRWALVTPFGAGLLRLTIGPDGGEGVAAWSEARTWRFQVRRQR